MAENERNLVQQFIEAVMAMPTGRKISFAVTLSTVVGAFVALLLWVNRPEYRVLFANLDAADAGRVTQKLSEKKVSFQLKEGGSTILVPDEEVYQLRLELASEGMPRGQNVGFEVFDEMKFGTSEFVQKLRYQQALQGELARTIMSFESVAQARVHIVAAGDSLFAEAEKPSTASVVLRLQAGRTLDRRQLHGIINLVARAVEGLKPENVSVVDMAGGLLSKGMDEDHASVLSRGQFEHQEKLERSLQSRIQTMLEPVVGANKVVARVSADLDFGQVNIVEEKYDPESAVVRSEQRQKETSGSGARPPAGGSPDLQTQVGQGQAGPSGSRTYETENATVNYEINKINKKITSSVGELRRISAAVIIDGPYVTEKDGEGKTVQKFVPRDRRDMKTFEDIVKRAVGFNEARGDQVTVSNIPFLPQEEIGGAAEQKEPVWVEYGKKAVRPLFNVVLLALFLLFAVRPFRKWLSQAGERTSIQALPMEQEVPRLPHGGGEARVGGGKETIMELTKGNPDVAAEIIRNWLSEVR